MSILKALRSEFRKFRIFENLNFHPCNCYFLFDIGNIIKDEKLYIIGGSMGQKTVAECEAYNLDNKTWTHVAKLNTRK